MFRQVHKVMATIAVACFSVGAAQASVLDFEDVFPATGPHFFLADYHGFRFGTNDIATTAWFYTDEVSTFYTPSSPTHFIATDFNLYPSAPTDPIQATQSITSTVAFKFDGAWFTGENAIRYELYSGGVLVHTSADSALLTDTIPLFVGSGYTGLVDEVKVFGRQGFYALDDFTYNTAVSIPEPTSLALVLLAGVAGVGAQRARSKSSR